MIKITGSPGQLKVWGALVDLAQKADKWVLIGARMVELHAFEHGRVLKRLSLDGDALADARERPNPVRGIAQLLIDDGYELVDIGVMGMGHTFVRDGVELDLLAPEHLGEHSEEARTTVPPLHTVEVPGGRQALDRREFVEVDVGGRKGRLPRPNLLGAILIKARAVDVDDVPDNQRQDLAVLLSLVEDPDELAQQLIGSERNWLRTRREIDSHQAGCWIGMNDEQIRQGLSALRILGDF